MANMTWDVMASYSPLKEHGKHGLEKMAKHIKRLGQGGTMKPLLEQLEPFTNALRLSMVVLRTMECAHSVRIQAGVEESMVSMWMYSSDLCCKGHSRLFPISSPEIVAVSLYSISSRMYSQLFIYA